MVVDEDTRTVIATTPKCGTKSIEQTAANVKLSVTGNGRHSCLPPAGKEGYTRLMTVRNPWSRIVSVWSYLAVRHWEFQEGDVALESNLTEFMWWWENRRREVEPKLPVTGWVTLKQNMMWYVTAMDFAQRFRPHGLIRVEHLADDLVAHGLMWGRVHHTNTTTQHRPGDWWDYYTDDLWERVGQLFAYEEAEAFGYSPERPGTLGARATALVT